MLHLWELLLVLGGKGQPERGLHGRRDLLWQARGAWLSRECARRWVSCLFPCCSVVVKTVACESVGASHDAVAVTESILRRSVLEKQGLPGGSCLRCLKSLWVGRRRARLTATSANSLGKPKGTLRQPRSLSVPEEGSKRPVPRPLRGRGVACGVVKPSTESARSTLPPATGSGPPKEIPMQRHVTVVNRSVCARLHACERGGAKCGGPSGAAVPAVRWEVGMQAPTLAEGEV